MKDADKLLRNLLAFEEQTHGFAEAQVTTLIHAIDGLKALDPAVGSGAFPMGILHKLVSVLGKLDPHNERWKQTQLDKLDSASMREELERTFQDNDDDYSRKLFLIENCIYGVDIQPIAVQIARMRFFISLIVDQKVDPEKPNQGVRPLPNLETRFVAANSLIGIKRPGQLVLRNPAIDEKENELRRVRDRFFTAKTPTTKMKYRDEDAQLRAEIANLLKGDGLDPETARLLAAWDPYDQNASAGFFDPEWMFGVHDGFGLVIGNPPFGVEFSVAERQELKALYSTYALRGESYVLFIERGVRILSSRGVLSFIAPDTYLNLGFTQSLRDYLLRNTRVLEIFALPSNAFESAVVDTTLLFLGNTAENRQSLDYSITVKRRGKSALHLELTSPDKQFMATADDWKTQRIFNIHSNPEEVAILRRVDSSFACLEEYADVLSGIKAYEVGKGSPPQTCETRDTKPFTSTTRKSNEWAPFYQGKHVVRYGSTWSNSSWIKYGPWLAAPRDVDRFRGCKLFLRKMVDKRLVGTYIPEDCYCNTLLFIVKCKGTQALSEKYLLAILCSSFIGWYFRKRFQISEADTFPQILARDLLAIPVPIPNDCDAAAIEGIVDRILAARNSDSNADISALDRELDGLIYRVYGINPKEIAGAAKEG